MTFPAFLSHPLLRLALCVALLATALGVVAAGGTASSLIGCAALAIVTGTCAMRMISAPLDLALSRTCETAIPPPRLRDPVFYLIGVTVFVIVAAWCGMFYLFGRATSAMAYISFTLAQ